MLQLLKESVSSRHAERLETIVIWLIVIEISTSHLTIILLALADRHLRAVLGIITVVVDLFSTA